MLQKEKRNKKRGIRRVKKCKKKGTKEEDKKIKHK